MDYFKVAKFFSLLPLVGIAIVTPSTMFPFIVGKYVWFRTVIDIALILFCLGLLLNKQGAKDMYRRLAELFRKPLVIAVTIFVAVFLLAGFFGVRPLYSFWSNFERGEGGLQMLHFWSFFILLLTLFRTEEDWKRVLKWALAGGVLMAVYGFFAAFDVQGFLGARFKEFGSSFRFQGSIGNPAYVATYSIFMMFYVGYLLLKKSASQLKSASGIFLWILLAFFLAVFLLAATRGGFVGLGVSLLAVLAYVGFKHKRIRKMSVGIAVLFVILVALLVGFRNTDMVKNIPGSRLLDLSVTSKTFQDRMIMWETAWNGFLERPVLGWGPENFLLVFDQHFNTEYYTPEEGFGAWFDRAHNIYLDYLVSTGIVGLLSFLAIFATFYVQFFRYSGKTDVIQKNGRVNKRVLLENGLFFGLLFAYLVQGIVLFDVSPIYMNIFLFLALSVWKFGDLRKGLHNEKKKS